MKRREKESPQSRFPGMAHDDHAHALFHAPDKTFPNEHARPCGTTAFSFLLLPSFARSPLFSEKNKKNRKTPLFPLAKPGGFLYKVFRCAEVAQLVEQGTENPRVGSSILSLGTIFFQSPERASFRAFFVFFPPLPFLPSRKKTCTAPPSFAAVLFRKNSPPAKSVNTLTARQLPPLPSLPPLQGKMPRVPASLRLSRVLAPLHGYSTILPLCKALRPSASACAYRKFFFLGMYYITICYKITFLISFRFWQLRPQTELNALSK